MTCMKIFNKASIKKKYLTQLQTLQHIQLFLVFCQHKIYIVTAKYLDISEGTQLILHIYNTYSA